MTLIDRSLRAQDTDPAPVMPSEEYRQIFFEIDKDNISMEEERKIRVITEFLNTRPNAVVNAVGYASMPGGAEYNKNLSRRRANAVVNTLRKSVALDSIEYTIDFKGQTEEFGEGRERWGVNQRVNVVIRVDSDSIPEDVIPLSIEEPDVIDINESPIAFKKSKDFLKDGGDIGVFEYSPLGLKHIPNQLSMIIDLIDMYNDEVAIEIAGRNVHSIKLSPNTEDLSINFNKKISREKTMTRWIEYHWGDEIDDVSFNGSTFSFNIIESRAGLVVGSPAAPRILSNAYNYLRRLTDIFNNTGLIFQDKETYIGENFVNDEERYRVNKEDIPKINAFLNSNKEFIGNHPRRGLLQERVYVRITFDYLILYGYFESFNIKESNDMPFRLTYDAKFKAEKTEWVLR